MSFSFSFSGDDIEEDTAPNAVSHNHSNASTSEDVLTSKLQKTTLSSKLFPPRVHTLRELLTGLPSQLSYNCLEIPTHHRINQSDNETVNGSNGAKNPSQTRIPRRSLFDIRQQLMAESDPSNTEDGTGNLLSGLETGDLTSGIYEGGFKTWECAVDLAGFVNGALDDADARPIHVIELGAGSAVPALMLLSELLKERLCDKKHRQMGKVKFTLCDYNEDVLRLGTAMNIYLLATSAIQEEDGLDGYEDEGDIYVDEDDVEMVLNMFEDVDVQVEFVSGAWSQEFVQLVKRDDNMKDARLLLLASETIYSPDSLGVFSQTVLDLLKSSKEEKRAYIAAKKVYFGVGGGVQEFEEEAGKLGGKLKTVLDVRSAGVGRVILEMSAD